MIEGTWIHTLIVIIFSVRLGLAMLSKQILTYKQKGAFISSAIGCKSFHKTDGVG